MISFGLRLTVPITSMFVVASLNKNDPDCGEKQGEFICGLDEGGKALVFSMVAVQMLDWFVLSRRTDDPPSQERRIAPTVGVGDGGFSFGIAGSF